jgi:peptidoglycan/LPS O-acetylase OafA/YrhL
VKHFKGPGFLTRGLFLLGKRPKALFYVDSVFAEGRGAELKSIYFGEPSLATKNFSKSSVSKSKEVVRIKALDSLRGLAASEVLIGHSLVVFQVFLVAAAYRPVANSFVNWMVYTPLHLLWAGGPAVIFFFMLSGFVLALPYAQKQDLPYPVYLIRRLCRVYVPYLALIGLSVFFLKLNFCHKFMPGTSLWINSIWSVQVSDTQIIRVLFMAGNPFSYNIAPTTWSLVHEMRISILFPLICMLVLNWDFKKNLALSLGIAALGVGLTYFSILSFLDLNLTVFYISFFIVGALLAKSRLEIVRWMRKRNRFEIGGFLFLGLFFYSWDWTIRPSFFLNLKFGNDFLTDGAAGLAAALFICLALSVETIRKKLESKPLLWLGKVSYSLYLFHPMILLFCVYYLRGPLTIWGSDLLGFCLSLLAAEFFYRTIEKPAIQWGKKIVEKMRARPGRSRTKKA